VLIAHYQRLVVAFIQQTGAIVFGSAGFILVIVRFLSIVAGFSIPGITLAAKVRL
jgi:hypothetical protein